MQEEQFYKFENNQPMNYQAKLCLNPDCRAFSRIFTADDCGPIGPQASLHRNCGQWCCSIEELKQMCRMRYSADKHEASDFLKQPIRSIFEVNSLLQHGWREQILKIFGSIKNEVLQALDRVMKNVIDRIQNQTKDMSKVCIAVQELIRQFKGESWSLKHERIYKQNIEKQVVELKNIGLLRTINYQSVAHQVDNIRREVDRLEWGMWQREPDFDRKERELDQKGRQELEAWASTTNIDQINKILTKITGTLKLKKLVFNEEQSQTSIECGKCSKMITSFAQFKQPKRSECLSNLLKHMCHQHDQDLLDICINKARTNHLLTFQEFLKDIATKNVKKFLIIDRENIKTDSIGSAIEKDLYSIEIVSKGRDNLASGKYLVAQSSGKDAADILIIIVLYEIGRVLGQVDVTLLTKDHFGKTLVPILQAMGTRVHTSTRYN